MENNNKRMLTALVLGAILSLIIPLDYANDGLTTKTFFTFANPALTVIYALLLYIILGTVTKKDAESRGKIEIDQVKNIPVTIVRSIFGIFFGIILILVVPLFMGMVLIWGLELSTQIGLAICIGYIACVVYLIKRFYRKS